GAAADQAGNIYITDMGNQRVRRIDTSGTIITVAGNGILGFSGDGGVATSAELHDPYNIVVDAFGSVIFTDMLNDRVRKVISLETGIELGENYQFKEVLVYPVPSNGPLTINLNGNKCSRIVLFDLFGRIVYDRNLNITGQNVLQEMDLINLSDGVYLLQIQVAERLINKRIEVQR
ncbi:MAG TPA: T9SS type A sorting domain-containing protein, partial [Nitrosopumilaceae archaeon]|nr:T9SS type A sorting domain-containing protein [Nitrosopumilaceae archaeon]